jgi:hypothetical protein
MVADSRLWLEAYKGDVPPDTASPADAVWNSNMLFGTGRHSQRPQHTHMTCVAATKSVHHCFQWQHQNSTQLPGYICMGYCVSQVPSSNNLLVYCASHAVALC